MICMDRRWHSMPDVVWHSMPDVANFNEKNIRRQTCSAAWLAQCLAAVARRFFTPPEKLAPEGYSACMLEPGRA